MEGNAAGDAGRSPVRACNAPGTSLYLDQRGTVRVCCINSTTPLGNVRDASLRDLIDGPEARRLRDAMERHDYSLGCELCRPPSGSTIHPTAPARAFDDLEPSTDGWPRQLELALSNTCNLECTMCFGELSSRIRGRREGLAPLPDPYGEEFFAELDELLPHLESLRFIGGEPFLSRAAWRIWRRLDELGTTPRIHLTTNGTILDDRVRWLFRRFPVSVTVSMDGADAESYERIRIGARFDEVLTHLDEIQRLTQAAGTDASLAFCLSTETWSELPAVLALGEQRGLPVGINLVTEPARHSLWRAPADVLEGVAAAWSDIRDEIAASLEINRGTWLDNVEWAASAAADARRDAEGTAVILTSPSEIALDLARRHAEDAPILRVDLDGEGRITGVGPTDLLEDAGIDIDVESFLGRPFLALMSGPIVDHFGAAFTSHLDDAAARRVRLHRMTFAGRDGTSVQVTQTEGSEAVAFVSIRTDEGTPRSPDHDDHPLPSEGVSGGTRVSGGVDRAPVLRDPEADRAFRRDGFVVTDLTSPEHAQDLRRRVVELLPPDAGPFFSLYRDDTPELRRRIDDLVRRELDPLVEDLLIGQRTYLASALVKYPGDGSYLALHQDWSFVDESEHCNGLVWLALDDVDLTNGALQAVPGSHRLDLPFRGTPPGAQASEPVDDLLKADHLVTVPVARGRAVVYHDAVIHGSGANISDTPRVAVVVGFVSAEAELVHHTVDDDGVRWRHRVRDDFFFDYDPMRGPSGPSLIDSERWPFEPRLLGPADLVELPRAPSDTEPTDTTAEREPIAPAGDASAPPPTDPPHRGRRRPRRPRWTRRKASRA